MKSDFLILLENHQHFQKTNLVRILRQSVRSITSEIGKNLLKSGHHNLTARHLNVFENLGVTDNNIMSLASRAGISKQAMSKLVKEIASEGYVVVVTDKRDNRVQLVQLTDRGADFLSLLQSEIQSKCCEIVDLGFVQKVDIEAMSRVLEGISKYLEPKSPKSHKSTAFMDDI